MPAATASVLIVVVDVNDNLPQFGAASYVAEVEENKVPSDAIAIVWVSTLTTTPVEGGRASYMLCVPDLICFSLLYLAQLSPRRTTIYLI